MSTITPESTCCCCQKAAVQPPVIVEEVLTQPMEPATKQTVRTIPSLLISVLVAFFPKCPICWAAYMSLFGSLGLAKVPYMGWLYPVLLTFLGLHLWLLFKKVRQKGYGPFLLSLLGVVFFLVERIWFSNVEVLLYTGMALILSGSLWNNFNFNFYSINKLSNKLQFSHGYNKS
ncbi:MAG: hypothetical protein RIR11_2582 [Bacteroidota bacterium]|jgi:hypothetical protein